MAGAYVPYSDVYSQYQSYSPRERSRYEDEDAQDVVRQRQRDAYARPPIDYDRQRARYLNEARADRKSRDARGSSAPHDYYGRERRRPDSDEYSDYSDYSDSESRSRHGQRSRVNDQQVARKRTQSEADRAIAGDSGGAKTHRNPNNGYDGDIRSRVARGGKYLDASPDGILAAAAGAGVGAILTRRFGDRDHFEATDGSDKWKTLAGAVVGGLAANAAERKWKQYGEEKDRQSEARKQSEGG